MSAVGGDGWSPALLAAAARFAPDPAVALRLGALGAWPAVGDYDALLRPGRLAAALPGLRFALQPPRPRRRRARTEEAPVGYDASIVAGSVPTRARSWHDLFNALIWASMPRAKLALHRHQHRLIQERRAGEAGPRGAEARSRVEDAVAMLDEGGLLLSHVPRVAEALDRALDAGDTGAVGAMAQRGEVKAVVFGHALLEHLARGAERVRAFPVALALTHPDDLDALDQALAEQVERLGPPGDRPGLVVGGALFADAG